MSKEFIRREITVPPRVIVLLVTICILVFCIMIAVQSAQARRLAEEADAMQVEVMQALSLAEELKQRLDFTTTNEYIAQEARRRFGLMEAGEKRFVVEGAQSVYESLDDL